IYSWQVKAVQNGREFIAPRPPAPQATFRVLDESTSNALEQLRGTSRSSHLIMGLADADAGLLDEAEREFRALQNENPGDAIVRGLLEQIRSYRSSPTSTNPAQ